MTQQEEEDWKKYVARRGGQLLKDKTERQQLLDSFAKAAMQEQIGSDGYSQDPKFIVKHAYDIAEAMMQERERRMKG